MLEAIGKELKVIRIRNDLSLDDVAHDININRETLRRYENNSNGLSVERLEELLNYYNIEKSNKKWLNKNINYIFLNNFL